MDKKKVDNLINEYVDTRKRDADKDLAKFYAKEEVTPHQAKAPRRFNKAMLAGVICIIAVSVFLGIFLPIFLNKPDTQDPDIIDEGARYYDDEEIDMFDPTTIEEFNADNNSLVKSVISEVMESSYKIIKIRETSEVVGLKIDLVIWGERIEEVMLLCYIGKIRVTTVKFAILGSETTYNGQTVKYRREMENEYDYSYYIEFESNGVTYNIEASCFEEMDISELLDELFE
ncbi:MAG: hypothetical protein EOM87_00305 [Clostridia bacterium]|nr:hypothetical protein [Clostridia bacterium]